MVTQEEEYEIIPTSPIRRLERRMEKMETGSSGSEVRRLIDQIVELIKSNQRVIDDLVKSNFELRNEMSRIPGKIDQLLTSMNSFMDLLKSSATEEAGGDVSSLSSAINKLVEQNKRSSDIAQATLTSMENIDKRLKRIYTQQAMGYGR